MNRLFLLCAIPFAFAVSSCVKGSSEEMYNPTLEEAYLFLFETEGGTRIYEVDAEGAWTIEGAAAWCEMEPASGFGKTKVAITTKAYPAFNGIRSGTFTLKRENSAEKVPISIMQTGDPEIKIDMHPAAEYEKECGKGLPFIYANRQLTANGIGNEIVMEIKSNTRWEITGMNEWCNVYPSAGAGNKTVTIIINENDPGNAREAKLVLTGLSVDLPLTVMQLPQ